MFDRLGRVLCVECGGTMKLLDSDKGEALFKCCNRNCNHSAMFYWPTGLENQRQHLIA